MSETKIHVFKVGMTCEGCSGAVQRVLNKMKDKGIEDVTTDLGTQTVTVKTNLSHDEVLEAIKKTGKPTEYIKTL